MYDSSENSSCRVSTFVILEWSGCQLSFNLSISDRSTTVRITIRHAVFRYMRLQVDGGINGHDKGHQRYLGKARFKSSKLDSGDHMTDLGSPDTHSTISLNNSESNRTNLALTL